MSFSPAPHDKKSTTHNAPCDDARIAAQVLRGVQRMFRSLGFESVAEAPLGNGRRADVMAIGPAGQIHIVEIKSCAADYHSDGKWPEYRDYCDAFGFAVLPSFPLALLPDDVGLILADGYGGEIVRPLTGTPLVAARRKAVTLGFARLAAQRLSGVLDPAQAIDRI